MPIQSRHSMPIPQVSLPTYLFTSPSTPLPTTPLLISTSQPTHSLSLSTYRLFSQRIAAGLQNLGLQPGDRVLLFSGNTLFFPCVIMGVMMAGGIFTGANPGYVARELAYQLKDSGARYLVCAKGSMDTGAAAAKEVGLAPGSVFVFDEAEDVGGVLAGQIGADVSQPDFGLVKHWSALLAPESAGRDFEWENLTTPEQLSRVIALNYSSGTTGLPKGVMITHANYVANTSQILHLATLHPDAEAIRARQRHLCFLPFYHAMAQALFCVGYVKQRVPVYIMPRFDFGAMLANVQKFKITDLVLVPPVLVAMAKHPLTKTADLSSVERVASGAAPLGREVCAEFEKLWPDGRVNVKQGWGMTEITCAATAFHPEAKSMDASVGELAPNVEAKFVLDDEGRQEVKGPGERGEIWIRAPNVMRGYWRKEEATRETLVGGWLRTGDIGYYDEEGHIFIVDRMKELIKVKGLQVAPAELEALLLDHPAVADVAVIGVTIDSIELPRAYIVPADPSAANPELAASIASWLAERVSRAKRLDGGVFFVEAIPKNPSGKIMRRVLREQAQKEIAEMERKGRTSKL